MATIRVEPQNLLKNSYSIKNIAESLEKVASAVQSAANSAPSYNGQFGPRVQQIGLEARQSGSSKSQAVRDDGSDLADRAEKFQKADTGKGFSNLEQYLAEQAGWKDIPNWERKWNSILEAIKIAGIIGYAPGLSIALNPFRIKSWWDKAKQTIKYFTTIEESAAWSDTSPDGNTKVSLFKVDEFSLFPFLDLKKWKGSGNIFKGAFNHQTNAKDGKNGFLFNIWDKDKSVLENLQSKCKVDIPLLKAGGSVFSYENNVTNTDIYGNTTSRSTTSLDLGKAEISSKLTLGGSDGFSAEIAGEISLASGKYEKVWGKEDDFVQPTFSSEVTVGKVGGSAKISKDGVEAKVGVTLVEATVSGGANIGNVNVGVSATARVGWEWGFKCKSNEVSVDIGPFSFGLNIGKRK